MTPRAAVAELEAVVATLDDMHHAARRHGVGIVVHGEDAAVDVGADAERVPEAGRHAAKFLAVGRTPEHVAALAAARDGGAVGADQLVIGAEVLAHAEKEIAVGVETQSRQPVVRIVALRVEKDNPAPLAALPPPSAPPH